MGLADKKQNWQFQFVTIFGATTERITGMGSAVPLFVEQANVPIGSNAGTDANPLTVTGPYILINFGVPTDPEGFTLTGNIRIQRKSREFSRDITDPSNSLAELILDLDLTADIGTVARDTLLDEERLIDHDIGQPGDIWYYTIFYEVVRTVDASTLWAFSPDSGHDRGYAYQNSLDASGAPFSRHGSAMFDRLPRAWKILDFRDGKDTVYRMMQIHGRLFDQLREDAENHLAKMYDPDNVDAALLPYIDWLFAWPTNYELPELRRRRETKQATVLWKSKGTRNALETALQTITGWNVTIIEGWRWVALAYDKKTPLDPAVVPPDWNEPTDGVWADLVNAQPLQITYDPTNPEHGANIGTRKDKLVYTYRPEVINETGVGWWWQNPNGILILLQEIPGVSEGLPETVVRKVSRIAPLFAMHYAAFAIMIEVESDEIYGPLDPNGDYYEDLINGLHPEQYGALPSQESFNFAETPDKCLLYSWPHPDFPILSASNSPNFWTYHTALSYGCTTVAGNIVTETGDPIVTETGDNITE